MTRLHTPCTEPTRSILITLASLLWLAACGGDGGGSGGANSPDRPDLGTGSESPSGCGTGAIEGGGRQKLSGVVTAIEAGGRLVVGRTNFATDGASIQVDGMPATLASLHRGDVVTVTGSIDAAQQTGCANAVFADASIVGNVQLIDPKGQSFQMFSQTVVVRVETVFASADGLPFTLSSLQLGDRVRVSGVPSDGAINATRVERVSDSEGYVVTGTISSLDRASQQFQVNGIGVQYDAANTRGFPDDQLHEGDPVRLSGTELSANLLRPESLVYIDYDTQLSVLPATAGVEVGASVQFRAFVSSREQLVSWSVLDSDGRACEPSNCGSIDATGRYTAPTTPPATFNPLVRATSVADPSASVDATVFVYAASSGLVVVPASVTIAAGASQSFSTFDATGRPLGGDRDISWSVAGDTCAGAACGTIDATGNYQAPAVLTAPAAVVVTARDAANPGLYGAARVNLGSNPSLARLQGKYAFSLTGFDGDGHVMAIGSVRADGAGQITSGVQHVSGQMGFSSFAPVAGRYSINGDNRGYLQLDLPPHGIGTLSLALTDIVGGVAQTVRVTSRYADRVFRGTMRRQEETAFSTASLDGDFAFGLAGEGNSDTFHLAAAGRFTIAAGQLTAGQIDHSQGGSSTQSVDAITGAVSPTVDANGEVRLHVSIGSLREVTQFIGFIVSTDEVLLMQSDTRSTWRVPGISGSMLRQRGGPFDNRALIGESVVCFSGVGYPPILRHHASAGDGRLSSTSLYIDDFRGLFENAQTATYAVAPNGRATMVFGPSLQQPLLYFVEPGKAFVIDQGSLTGMLYPTRPTANALSGNYVLSSQPESMNWWISASTAALTASPAGSFTGTLDGDVSGRALAGTYVLDAAGDLRIVSEREGEAPTEGRFLLASDSFGLGISTGDTYIADGCRVIER